DHLVKVVFPALREQLEPYRVHLVDVDLRCGVTREQAESDRALDVCLHFIDECRPFFVGLLGERYGSVTETIPTDTLTRYGLLRAYQQRSITEFEILYGVLHNPAMRGHAFFYLRDRAALNGVPQPIRESVYAETDPVLIAKLENLKQRIRDSGYPVVDGYPAQWDAEAFDRPTRSHGRLVGLEKFGERIHDDLWKAIKAELQLADSPPATAVDDPQEEEDDFHRRFVESRTRIYVGLSEIQEQLLEHVAGEETKPLLVTGASGSGKSAILARLAEALTDTRSATGERQIVIPHFVGASPGSTSIRLTLRRLCLALQKAFALEGEVPEGVNELVKTFRDFINEVPLDRRAVIIIDAINQFDETDRAHDLWWIPYALPVNVKLVLSCIDEPGRDQPILERTRRHKMIEVTVPPLTDSDRREIIRQVPSLSAKALDDHQIDLLLPNPATSNPLFLLVALEELRGFGSYEQLNDRIAALPRDGDPVTALFTQVIERLEEEFDKATVHDILTLLASARRGLSERELQELLGPAPFDGAGGIGPQPPTP
ncbi:MAG: NACHT domain-containing protein, partial [Chloroflexi bacterium]|nr:NACHT domain-containing protein [Chloroflexota bacterium]